MRVGALAGPSHALLWPYHPFEYSTSLTLPRIYGCALMAGWWRRATGLTRAEVGDLLRAKVALARAQALLWTRRRGAMLSPTSPVTDAVITLSQLRRADTLGWAVTRAARYGLMHPRCLARSIALQQLLRREGIVSSQLHLGVRPEGSGLLAHAWVTVQGVVVGDDARFVGSFQELPGTAVAHLL